MKIKIGVNSYAVRRYIERNEAEAYWRLQKIGFDFVEPLIAATERQENYPKFLISEERLPHIMQLLQKDHFPIGSAHVAYPGKDGTELAQWLERIHAVTGVTTFVMGTMMKTQEQAEEMAHIMSVAQAQIRHRGWNLVYHNHREELTKLIVNGETTTVLEHFLHCCTENILLETDIGWLGAVTDEIAAVERLKDKILVLHLKDLAFSYDCGADGEVPDHQFVSIGSGRIRTAQILRMLDSFPNFSGMVVIDQDASGNDIYEDLEKGFRWVKSLCDSIQ